jgi:hypothetical protein
MKLGTAGWIRRSMPRIATTTFAALLVGAGLTSSNAFAQAKNAYGKAADHCERSGLVGHPRGDWPNFDARQRQVHAVAAR